MEISYLPVTYLPFLSLPPQSISMPPKSAKRARVPTLRDSTYVPKPTAATVPTDGSTQSWITTVKKMRDDRSTVALDNTQLMRTPTPSTTTGADSKLPGSDTSSPKPKVPEVNVKKRKRVYTTKVCFSVCTVWSLVHFFSVYNY